MKLLAGLFFILLIFAVIMAIDLGISLGLLHLTGSGTAALIAGIAFLLVTAALLGNRALNKIAAEKKGKGND